jgi:hypothetical protein
MPMTVNWDNAEQTTLRIDTHGQSTWEEHFNVQDQMREMLKSVQHPVDMIVVLHPGAEPPSGNLLSHISRAAQKAPRNLRFTVNVGMSPFMKAITQVATKVLQMKTHYTTTLEEARAIIKVEREKISASEAKQS